MKNAGTAAAVFGSVQYGAVTHVEGTCDATYRSAPEVRGGAMWWPPRCVGREKVTCKRPHEDGNMDAADMDTVEAVQHDWHTNTYSYTRTSII